MNYVGIDQSLSSTGVTIMKEGEKPSFHSIVPDKENNRGVKRLSFISNCILNILKDIKGDFIVCREDYAYGGKGNVFSLGELGGCIDMKLYESINKYSVSNVRYYSIPINSWKLLVFGNGSVKKDTEYLLKVFNKTGVQFKCDDMADSYMIMLAIKKMHEFNFEKLTIKEKFGMLSSDIRKKNKITETNIKNIEKIKFIDLVNKTLDEYLIFSGGVK